jgi:FdhD protein
LPPHWRNRLSRNPGQRKTGARDETIWRYEGGHWAQQALPVIVEAPFSIAVNGQPLATLLCTPTDLRALAIGFLYNEELIGGMAEVHHMDLRADGRGADVWLYHDLPQPEQPIRTSGCTGGLTFHESAPADFHLAPGVKLTPAGVSELMHTLVGAAGLYRQARGVHCSALCDGEQLLVVAEDVGRHNTLDKIAGLCQLQGISTQARILLTTGRISSEMLRKAARMGVPILISRTSPTGLSVRLARAWGLTLVGYARAGSFNVYAGRERIEAPGPHVLSRRVTVEASATPPL